MLVDIKYIIWVNTYQVPGGRSGTWETGNDLIIIDNCRPLNLNSMYPTLFSTSSSFGFLLLILQFNNLSDPLGSILLKRWSLTTFSTVPHPFMMSLSFLLSLITIFIHYGHSPVHTVNSFAFFLTLTHTSVKLILVNLR